METAIIPLITLVILNIVIAMIWYSPKVFGTVWANALNFKMENMKASPLHYLGSTCITIVVIGITYYLIKRFQINDPVEGLELGLIIWVGFILSNQLSAVIWSKKPLKAYYVEAGHLFVTTLLNWGLLSVWK